MNAQSLDNHVLPPKTTTSHHRKHHLTKPPKSQTPQPDRHMLAAGHQVPPLKIAENNTEHAASSDSTQIWWGRAKKGLGFGLLCDSAATDFFFSSELCRTISLRLFWFHAQPMTDFMDPPLIYLLRPSLRGNQDSCEKMPPLIDMHGPFADQICPDKPVARPCQLAATRTWISLQLSGFGRCFLSSSDMAFTLSQIWS